MNHWNQYCDTIFFSASIWDPVLNINGTNVFRSNIHGIWRNELFPWVNNGCRQASNLSLSISIKLDWEFHNFDGKTIRSVSCWIDLKCDAMSEFNSSLVSASLLKGSNIIPDFQLLWISVRWCDYTRINILPDKFHIKMNEMGFFLLGVVI